eukprot:11949-Hanusia_phi.AAC.2
MDMGAEVSKCERSSHVDFAIKVWGSDVRIQQKTLAYGQVLPKKENELAVQSCLQGGRCAARCKSAARREQKLVRDCNRQSSCLLYIFEYEIFEYELIFERIWEGHRIDGAAPIVSSERFKGKVASWTAHRVVWQRMLYRKNVPKDSWFVVLEDDVRMMDTVEAFMEKMSVTLCL